MAVTVQYLSVMRYTDSQDPGRIPRPKHSLHTTIVGAVVATMLVPVITMAVAYPIVGIALVALALAARPTLRGLRQLHQARQRQGRTRQICVPKTSVCAEV